MIVKEPATELHPQFSNKGATPTPWAEARDLLEKAEVYWLSTVRPNGRPHVTPVVSVWLDDALYFCTGPGEHKAKNLARNTHLSISGSPERQYSDSPNYGEKYEVLVPDLL